MDAFFTSSGLIALGTLTFLEIVLGVDNIIFISILSSKLPGSQQRSARQVGLVAAMGMRILFLLCLVWIIRLTAPLFYILGRPISGRDLILIGACSCSRRRRPKFTSVWREKKAAARLERGRHLPQLLFRSLCWISSFRWIQSLPLSDGR